jgi:hypothetical protein
MYYLTVLEAEELVQVSAWSGLVRGLFSIADCQLLTVPSCDRKSQETLWHHFIRVLILFMRASTA